VRLFLLLLAAALLAGCMPILPPVQYGALPALPYAACGEMAGLRSNLTGAPDPSPWSDAQLHVLGVRCLARPVALAPPAARYRTDAFGGFNAAAENVRVVESWQ